MLTVRACPGINYLLPNKIWRASAALNNGEESVVHLVCIEIEGPAGGRVALNIGEVSVVKI